MVKQVFYYRTAQSINASRHCELSKGAMIGYIRSQGSFFNELGILYNAFGECHTIIYALCDFQA